MSDLSKPELTQTRIFATPGQKKLYFSLHVSYFSYVYEIRAEAACGLNALFWAEYGWSLCGNFQNYVW